MKQSNIHITNVLCKINKVHRTHKHSTRTGTTNILQHKHKHGIRVFRITEVLHMHCIHVAQGLRQSSRGGEPQSIKHAEISDRTSNVSDFSFYSFWHASMKHEEQWSCIVLQGL